MLAHGNIISSQNDMFFSSHVSSMPSLDVDQKIKSFLVSNPFYTPKAVVAFTALDWRIRLSDTGFGDIDAFPGQSGEILVSGIGGDFCFEVTIEDDMTFSVAFEYKSELIFSFEKLTSTAAREKLNEAVGFRWISSNFGVQKTSVCNR